MKDISRRHVMLASVASTLGVSACATEAPRIVLGAAKAGAVVLSAQDMAIELLEYLDGDPEATQLLMSTGGPVEYALGVSEFLKGETDTPLITLVITHRLELARFKVRMQEARDIVIDYATRTGKPVPGELVGFWQNGVDAVKLVDAALQDVDVGRGSSVYSMVAPYAVFGLRLKGVPIPPGLL